MDLKDQLKDLFPDHEPPKEPVSKDSADGLWIQDDPLRCLYEKRKGKPITLIDGYTGTKADFKELAKALKKELSVGGTVKKEQIIIQGDYRDRIMQFLKDYGFKVKRVGG